MGPFTLQPGPAGRPASDHEYVIDGCDQSRLQIVNVSVAVVANGPKLSVGGSEHHSRQKQEMGLSKVDVAYNPNYIVSLAVDAEGVVWAGTWGGGLSRFDGQKWTQYTTHEGLPGNHVFMLHVDPRGQLWAGTNNGLAKMKPGGGFEVMTVNDGLFSNVVFSMATARDGTRWIGSFGGVAHIREGAFK